jgi:hypothetical protein
LTRRSGVCSMRHSIPGRSRSSSGACSLKRQLRRGLPGVYGAVISGHRQSPPVQKIRRTEGPELTGGDTTRRLPITRNEGVPGSSPGVGSRPVLQGLSPEQTTLSAGFRYETGTSSDRFTVSEGVPARPPLIVFARTSTSEDDDDAHTTLPGCACEWTHVHTGSETTHSRAAHDVVARRPANRARRAAASRAPPLPSPTRRSQEPGDYVGLDNIRQDLHALLHADDRRRPGKPVLRRSRAVGAHL